MSTLRIQHKADCLVLDAWGAGGEQSLDFAPKWLGFDGPCLADVPKLDPIIDVLQRSVPGTRVGRTDEIVNRLFSVTLGQKVTGKNSKAAAYRLARDWGESPPGPHPNLWLFPEPKRLAGVPYHHFHPLGIERRRADLLRLIASRAGALNRALGKAPDAAQAHLRALPGIGPWTSAIVVGSALGDPDAIPVGDAHLPNWVSWHFAGEPRGDDSRMLALLDPYRGYRGLIARALKLRGKPPPRYGPKSTGRDIRET
ncbi:MAG: DNA-3-methyladenine glycosylase [Myxococcota bacterium]